MLSNTVKALFCVLISFLITNCGTIIHGSKQEVYFLSTPKKAEINIDGVNVGTTPFLARLIRKNNHLVKIDLPGYDTYQIMIKRKLDAWILGNVIFGGIIGIAVDAATGSMYKLSPGQLDIDMKSTPVVNSDITSKDGIYIAVVMHPNSSWEKVGTLNKSQSIKEK